MAFTGWPEAGLDWLEDIVDRNERSWFLEHKATYEACVRGPMQALVDELAAEFGPGKVFRPYRDVRFAKDKTPYKTNVSATCGMDGGRGTYVQLAADGLLVAAGCYQLGGASLAAYRSAVDGPAGAELEAILAAATKAGMAVSGERLATAPRGWAKDHPRIDLLRHKGLYLSRQHEPGPWLHTKKARDRVVAGWRAAAPLRAWFDAHVPADPGES